MSGRRYFWFFSVILILSGISLAGIFYITNPREAGLILKLLIYANIFFLFFSFFSVLFLKLRRFFKPDGLIFEEVSVSLRQAGLLALFLAILAFFSSRKLLKFYFIIPLGSIFLIPEIYFYYKIVKRKIFGD
ncbi:MAG: hypothetical protein HYV52_02680 [Parcubacteria group bacterium]|nr:hypothetical protein [Parcubacteria group bacterium]